MKISYRLWCNCSKQWGRWVYSSFLKQWKFLIGGCDVTVASSGVDEYTLIFLNTKNREKTILGLDWISGRAWYPPIFNIWPAKKRHFNFLKLVTILKIEGRTDGNSYGSLDGQTNPNCIVIKKIYIFFYRNIRR